MEVLAELFVYTIIGILEGVKTKTGKIVMMTLAVFILTLTAGLMLQ